MLAVGSLLITLLCCLFQTSYAQSQVIPYEFEVNLPSDELFGSQIGGKCNISRTPAELCLHPADSVLFDGMIPTINMSSQTWATELLAFRITNVKLTFLFMFDTTPFQNNGQTFRISRIEIVMLNCAGADNVLVEDSDFHTLEDIPLTSYTSCDEFIRICTSNTFSTSSETIKLEFNSPSLNQELFFAEIYFYSDNEKQKATCMTGTESSGDTTAASRTFSSTASSDVTSNNLSSTVIISVVVVFVVFTIACVVLLGLIVFFLMRRRKIDKSDNSDVEIPEYDKTKFDVQNKNSFKSVSTTDELQMVIPGTDLYDTVDEDKHTQKSCAVNIGIYDKIEEESENKPSNTSEMYAAVDKTKKSKNQVEGPVELYSIVDKSKKKKKNKDASQMYAVVDKKKKKEKKKEESDVTNISQMYAVVDKTKKGGSNKKGGNNF